LPVFLFLSLPLSLSPLTLPEELGRLFLERERERERLLVLAMAV
jgi:hypothetical protein